MIYKMSKVKIAGVVKESIVDGPGLRFVLFAQGCEHGCEGCHNGETHDPEGGYWCDFDNIIKELELNPLITGVTFSGGEPFLQAKAFSELAGRLKKMTVIEKRIVNEGDMRRIVKEEKPRNLHLLAFTGFTLEELILRANSMEFMKKHDGKAIYDLLHKLDALIDGPFVMSEKDLTLRFMGSKNQRYLEKPEIEKMM